MSRRQRQALLEAKEALEAQAPKGAAPDPFEQERYESNDDRATQDGQPAVSGAAAEESETARGR